MAYDKIFTDALQFAWGKGFLSPGGPEEVRNLLKGHDIAGTTVLDIGCGLGGVDLLLVSEHGAHRVTGIDVDPWLIDQARQLAGDSGMGDRVRFELVDPGPLPFADESFDVVFSKDAMVHVPDKPALYAEVLRVLKPQGRFIAADWLFAEGAATSPEIEAWLPGNPLRFSFTTLPQALDALRIAGFADPYVHDRRAFLQEWNRREITLLEGDGMERLAAIVGGEVAVSRLAGARGRQGALDSGALIPSHLGGRKRG